MVFAISGYAASRRRGLPTFCMTTVTGILEWPQRAEGRVRQLNGSTLIQREDDPFVPLALGERYKLRNGLEITVTVGYRGQRHPQGHGQHHPWTGNITPATGPNPGERIMVFGHVNGDGSVTAKGAVATPATRVESGTALERSPMKLLASISPPGPG